VVIALSYVKQYQSGPQPFRISDLATQGALLGATGVSERVETFQVDPSPENAVHARARFSGIAASAGFDGLALQEFVVAFGEAVSNAILYGGCGDACKIDVVCRVVSSRRTLTVEICDSGPGFDPAAARVANDIDDINGRGLTMMRALVDDMEIETSDRGTTVRLKKSP
jgi:anti-sigma regulatory factor (Ser/Thr protein kinase)